MHSRILLLSLGLHGAVIAGAATVWALGPLEQRLDLKLAVAPPAPDVPAPPVEAPPLPPRPDPDPDEEPLVEEELPVADRRRDLEPSQDDLGPWPSPRKLRWTPAALVALVPPPEAPLPVVSPQPPAPLIRARLLEGTNVVPEYPRSARRLGLEGVVVLRLHVDVDGAIGEVEVARPCRHTVLNDAAVSAARKWCFEPATRAGQAVADVVEKTVRFELRAE